MLNQQSVTSIYSLAQVAEQNKIIVLPHANTPLAVLNSAMGGMRPDAVEIAPALIAASESKDVLGDQEHSQAIDHLVDVAAEAVQRQLKFARELVRPIVLDAFERVSKDLDENPIKELRHSVVEVSLPAVMQVPALEDMVDRFKAQPQINLMAFGNTMPELTGEELVERCKTGMSSVDKELTSLIEASPQIVSRVYDEYFLGKTNHFGDEPGNYLAETVVAFALARNFNANAPEGVRLDLVDFRARTAHVVAEFGRRIFQALRRRNRIIRQNDMIAYMPRADAIGAEIKVNAEVYQKFLKEGGKPEAIIGACMRGIQKPSYADLLEDAHGGEKAVQSNERLLQSRIKNEYEANVHKAIITVLGQIIEAKEFPEGVPVPTIRDVKDFLKEKPFRKKFDLDNYVLRVVCGAMFPAYNAYPVLNGIMEHMANDDTLSQREAATLVTIDLVGEWLSAQLTTESV